MADTQTTKEMTTEQAAWYLAAMIDGEGCVHFSPDTLRRVVQITNTDDDLLRACEHAMDVLGLHRLKRYEVGRKDDVRKRCFTIRLAASRENYTRLRDLVPMQSVRKVAALNALIAAYQEVPSRPDRAWLEEHYSAKLWTVSDIAGHWRVAVRTVRYWMNREGIVARDFSTAQILNRWRRRGHKAVADAEYYRAKRRLRYRELGR